ncbi:predicted protein [Chaetoceros tenuissimus]|uniref:Uncharacterized protein n=1 Tax=Chaetoceros tenuissimus TaxID=426638 RepID=A0AAD3DC93_9STRA|nr:predicted protein [Chaetoceros tenuissimus]
MLIATSLFTTSAKAFGTSFMHSERHTKSLHYRNDVNPMLQNQKLTLENLLEEAIGDVSNIVRYGRDEVTPPINTFNLGTKTIEEENIKVTMDSLVLEGLETIHLIVPPTVDAENKQMSLVLSFDELALSCKRHTKEMSKTIIHSDEPMEMSLTNVCLKIQMSYAEFEIGFVFKFDEVAVDAQETKHTNIHESSLIPLVQALAMRSVSIPISALIRESMNDALKRTKLL